MQKIVPMSRNFLELRQGQQLTLTPALQQSIKLLQLSTLDLEAEVARALAENPLLEQEGTPLYEPGGAVANLRVGQESAEFDSAQSGAERGQDATPEANTDYAPASEREPERDRNEYSSESRGSRDDDFTDRPEPARESNLREYLLEQLGLTRLSKRDAAIVELLIDELNDVNQRRPSGMVGGPAIVFLPRVSERSRMQTKKVLQVKSSHWCSNARGASDLRITPPGLFTTFENDYSNDDVGSGRLAVIAQLSSLQASLQE
jgi:hypothetical protein